MRLIGPMFMDDLNHRYDTQRDSAQGLRALRRDLGQMRFLDPACGCGNFLVVAYRELRALELKILERLQYLQATGAGGKTAATSFDLSLMFDESALEVKAQNFHGIELEPWPAQIARTALHLADHQANLAMIDALGRGPATLPLNKVETITQANALETDWRQIVAPSEHLYIMGNPPFVGISMRSAQQVTDLENVWGPYYHGSLDYVTGWYAKALQLFAQPGYSGEFAYVSTNSITQGEPVSNLFEPIFGQNWRIKFAHRTFAWTTEAPGAAAVHCVIIGFDRRTRSSAQLFDYGGKIKGDGIKNDVGNINAYLINAPNVLVKPRTKPLANNWPEVRYGNKPTDDGNLIVELDEYDYVMADPIAAQYLRPFIGARELLHGEKRWCLWLVDLQPADLNKSSILKQRVEAVKEFRAASRADSTREFAKYPTVFRQITPVTGSYVCIPRVVSETREFFTVALEPPEVISSDSNFVADDPDGFTFAMLSSSVFITWQKAVGGRLKSDLRFSKLNVWNTLPLPTITPLQKEAIIAGGREVLNARFLNPERTLAESYSPLAITQELRKAHAQLDKAVDAVFGLKNPTNEQRLAALFKSYQQMTTAEQLPIPTKQTRTRKPGK